MQKLTSPFGPNANCAPLTFLSSRWTMESPDTRTQKEACAPPRLSEKTALAHDLARWRPVTRMMSSMRLTPKPRSSASLIQTSIFLTIHLPKSPSATVSSRSAGKGRYNKAPCLPEHEYVTCVSSSGLIQGGKRQESATRRICYPNALTLGSRDNSVTFFERKSLP